MKSHNLESLKNQLKVFEARLMPSHSKQAEKDRSFELVAKVSDEALKAVVEVIRKHFPDWNAKQVAGSMAKFLGYHAKRKDMLKKVVYELMPDNQE